jgi:hypothetical protein
MVTAPKPKPDHVLVDEWAIAKAELDEAKAKYDRLRFEVQLRIREKPGRFAIFGTTHEAEIEEVWDKDGRYDQTRLVQFRERADQHTAELLYSEAWIPEATKVIPGHWNITKLKGLAKRNGDLEEVEAAKLEPGYRVKLVVRK